MQTQILSMRRTALIGFLIGMTLGCLFGAVMGFLPSRDENRQGATLSVNPITGRAQLHIKGTQEIK
jgi:ABC-type nitrate/sulfonate/bicarbonate transport system permease component